MTIADAEPDKFEVNDGKFSKKSFSSKPVAAGLSGSMTVVEFL